MGKQRKDTILFLMEGTTDQRALRLILDEFFGAQNINICVTDGDICLRDDVTVQNIISEVSAEVNAFPANNSYLKGRILEIAHLIDTDGAFTPGIADGRFLNKQACARKLASLSSLQVPGQGNIPYRFFYFSRHQEHVLHNRQKVEQHEKGPLARKIQQIYRYRPDAFVRLPASPRIAVPGTYKETWDYIFEGQHSMQRGSNLRIFFEILPNGSRRDRNKD